MSGESILQKGRERIMDKGANKRGGFFFTPRRIYAGSDQDVKICPRKTQSNKTVEGDPRAEDRSLLK